MKKLIKSKSGLSMEVLVGLILAAVVLILFGVFSTNVLTESDYRNSIEECSYLFLNIDGKPAFFGNGLDRVSLNLVNSVKKLCPSKSVKLKSEKSVSEVADLTADCFRKTGKGVDFMPSSNTDALGICLYCGTVESEVVIDDFDEMFVKVIGKRKYNFLFNQSVDIVNMNSVFLKNKEYLPKQVGGDEKVSVFYYILKEEEPEQIKTLISSFIGSFGGWFTTLNYYLSSSEVRSVGGVLLTSQKEFDFKDDINKEKTDLFEKVGCNVIVPEKDFD